MASKPRPSISRSMLSEAVGKRAPNNGFGAPLSRRVRTQRLIPGAPPNLEEEVSSGT